VPDLKEFQKRIAGINDLVQSLEGAADPALRASAKELLQLVMEIHGAGLEKMMEIIFQSGDGGARIIDELGRDPLAGNLLILHGLHPEDVETRVSRALERSGPTLRKHGSEVGVISMEAGAVRLRVGVGEHSCGSTAKTVKAIVEQAIYDAAPDIASLTIEGADGKAASGFLALDALLGAGGNSGLTPAMAMAKDGGN
jgi:Fe-S cluster biogenesis protein NfuA